MSIQQVNSTSIQALSVKPSEEVVELAGSRAPPKAPERQRGLWSFLTWSFVVGPIMAAESFFGKDGHALVRAVEDQDNPSAGYDKGQPDSTSDHGTILATVPTASDAGRDDSDTSQLVGAARGLLRDGDPQRDENPIPSAASKEANADASSSGGGGGGGGDSNELNTSRSASSDSDSSKFHNSDGLSNGGPFGGIPDNDTPGSSPGGIPDSSPNPITVGTPPAGGPNVDISVGAEPILAHTSSDIVSSVAVGVPDTSLPVGLDTAVDLKDILGFDLHVNAAGAFVGTDLSAALDVNPSQLVAAVASTAISAPANSLPLLDFGVPKSVDGLLSGNNLFDIGHSAVPTSEVNSVLGSDSTASLKQLGDALMTSPESGSDTNLPVVSLVSDLTHVGGIVGKAADITSGDSIDFPPKALSQGDVLFSGNSYTDYNVALQTQSPSGAGNIIAETLSSVTNNHDAASPSHTDAPVASHDVGTPPAPEGAEASLTQILTALDELSLRGHTH